MADVTVGVWHDFIWHFRTDPDDTIPIAFNQGFCDIYKRRETSPGVNGPWVHVLAIRPHEVDYGGVQYNKGYGVAGGYYTSLQAGIYCSKAPGKDRVWTAPNNAVAYVDNWKYGDENVSFEQMTPDGSSL